MIDMASERGDDSGIESSNADSGDNSIYIRVNITELKIQKCLQFHPDDTVWMAKQRVLAILAKELKDSLNYGLYCPPMNGRAGKFLDEERPLKDYPLPGPIGFLEFKYKRRVYKLMQLNPRRLKQLHSRSNLRQFMEHVRKYDVNKIHTMTVRGLDPNFHEPETGETPLSVCSNLDKPRNLILALVGGGAHIDYRTRREGFTPLHRAAQRGNHEAIKTFLELGASPNYKDQHSLTPLYHCVCHDTNPRCVELLLHDHSIVGITDDRGWTEIHQACKNGRVQHLEHLLFYGADMNVQNSSGNTPLHVCAVNNQEECARVLLFRGVDRGVLNFANQDAFQVAVIAGNCELGNVIKNYKEHDVVPFQEVPHYNEKRCMTVTAATLHKLQRSRSDPRLNLIGQSKPSSPDPSNSSMPQFLANGSLFEPSGAGMLYQNVHRKDGYAGSEASMSVSSGSFTEGLSPIGEIFRARLRQFPALVNCCTIDWFSEWPVDALQSVAMRFLSDLPDLDADDRVLQGLVEACQQIHTSVAENSEKYLAELSRHNYVTPTSYLELLGIFNKLIVMKKMELVASRNRTKTGLDKLLSTGEEVAKLQEELEVMKPMLEEAVKESITTMEQITVDSAVAEETKALVQKEENQAATKARETQAIADDAQRDLNEALPALDAALQSLKSLNRNDVVEVRALMRPPDGVRLVIEAVCIMKSVKPKKVAGDKPGEKKDDYWEPGKALLQDPGKFLESLFSYDKDNIPDSAITKIQPHIDNENFTPQAISKVSKACTSICEWVRAMHKYHHVAKGVAPKREALRIAQADLAETQRILDQARKRLHDVEEGIATLQAKYDDCVRKKDELEAKCQECEGRLVRAGKLIGGLGDEKGRWQESVERLQFIVNNIVGDIVISAGFVAYLGFFNGEYRNQMVAGWIETLDRNGVPHNENCSLIDTLSDAVKIRSWQIAGLPKDNLSVENGVIVQYSRRWALFIDPQGQANKWIKNLERDNGLDVIKLSDKDFLRSLENAIRFGKPCLLENIGEDLDPALEPILLRQTFKQQSSLVIRLGDAVIPYHEDFKFFITTKLPNPHYTPEISTKVTLVNFTLSPSGLQDQLLGTAVAEERPDLEEAKNQLIISNAKMKQELKEIEDKILHRLSASEGSPVDDIDLINTLEASKIKAHEIEAKVIIAEQTERDIDETRSLYIPVAVNTQILFFCVADLANIDPMYQYSLEWFISIFLGGIANAERADNVPQRIKNINEYFTFSLYSNVCRSLFEKHKLLFAFLLSVRILMHEEKIDMDEWRFLLAGGAHKPKDLPNPASDWLSERSWGDVLTLAALPKYASIAEEFPTHSKEFQKIFDSLEPHQEKLPGRWDSDLDDFQKLLILKCLRSDKVTNAFQDFVANHLGQRFIEPQTANLTLVFKDSSPTTPLIFVLSTGTDPAADLYKFAEEMRFAKKLSAISLGQGQGPRAEAMMRSAMERGKWVFFQNCHLAPSFMPALERLIEQIDPDKVHRDFRLWLTSMPSPKFPVFILQNGSKMTVEPPRGIKSNLLRSYAGFTDDYLNSCGFKTPEFKHLLLSLCLYHGVGIERRKFGALGFNIPYEFTQGDLRICISQLKMFLEEYDEIPFKVLLYTAGHINYGGRVTDDWDRRCLMNVLGDFYDPKVLETGHEYSPSGIYKQIDTDNDHNGYVSYIMSLPINDNPEIFGLHDNANITFAQTETFNCLQDLLMLQPKSSSGGGQSREEVMEETAKSILQQVPDAIDIEMVMKKYPVMYEQSMNTVLTQEIIRYNRLLTTIKQSLHDLLKALKGLVVMSQALEDMANSLFINQVPKLWSDKAYPSLKPLASWVIDLETRMEFMKDWINNGIPPVFWISGFFFPQAFLTGTLQNYARSKVISIDTISFSFKVMRESYTDLKKSPEDGCYIRGLFAEGARWDMSTFQLAESRAKELFTDMPVIWLTPTANRKASTSGVYECPVYKTLTRAGTLSTTGHSTNFVFAVEIPTDKEQKHWIKRGVALLCALNY